MICPRCKAQLLRYEAPALGDQSVLIDRCTREPTCGIWYDADDLPGAHARFANKSVRDALLGTLMTARASQNELVPCPRCLERGLSRLLTPVRFLGVVLDLCEGCHGLWIDSSEYASLLSALQLYEPGQVEQGGHYRAAPVGQVMKRRAVPYARCALCKAQAPLADTLLSERGIVCVLCAKKLAEDDSPLRESREGLWGSVRRLLASLLEGA